MSGTGNPVSFSDISTKGLLCPSLGAGYCLAQSPHCRSRSVFSPGIYQKANEF
ncbi:MAG: hypothetical protein HOJ13_08775 [Nitrospina sp.]|nr:hypothetical protein [Nitrospina sp.]